MTPALRAGPHNHHNTAGETRMSTPSTARILRDTAFLIHEYGLHPGPQFVDRETDAMDVCAAVYLSATETLPDALYTDEAAGERLIQSNKPAMAAIKAISDALDSDVCETNGQPDYIEHVSNWAVTPLIGQTTPPTTAEVIGRIFRAADQAANAPAV